MIPGTKHPKIILNHYLFTIHRKSGIKSRWRCNRYARHKGWCKASLITCGKVLYVSYDHNHPCEHMSLHNAVPQQVIIKRVK